MRYMLYVALVLLVGCQNTVGPRERRFDGTRIDDPRLTIDEQQQRGRQRLALGEQSPTIVPPADLGPSGR